MNTRYSEVYVEHKILVKIVHGRYALYLNGKYHNSYATCEQAIKISRHLLNNEIY